jgi:UDP-N-acetylmuramate dehydrogenase
MKITEHTPLALRTTMKVGGSARYYIECETDEDVLKAINFAEEHNVDFFILGKGSNTFFNDDGFPGAVISFVNTDLKIEDETGALVTVIAGAGIDWDTFVGIVTKKGFFGVENLSLIPGTVGASPVQNIGAYGVELQDVFLWADVFNIKTKKMQRLHKADCMFAYRHSIFKTEEGKKFIVLRVAFLLSKVWQPHLNYPDVQRFMETTPITNALEARRAIVQIRQGKLPDETHGSAGSFFKNPIVDNEIASRLSLKYPEMPVFDISSTQKKLSAGWILDHVCGLKGYREGSVALFEKQALVVVTFSGATSRDVILFTENISRKFFDATGVVLEREVCVI